VAVVGAMDGWFYLPTVSAHFQRGFPPAPPTGEPGMNGSALVVIVAGLLLAALQRWPPH